MFVFSFAPVLQACLIQERRAPDISRLSRSDCNGYAMVVVRIKLTAERLASIAVIEEYGEAEETHDVGLLIVLFIADVAMLLPRLMHAAS